MVERRQLLVKFVPWNENTFLSLKHKTIKFSKAYELNDYNEFNYIGPSSLRLYEKERQRIKAVVTDLFSDYAKRCELFRNLGATGTTYSFVKKFIEKFQNFDDFIKKFDTELSSSDINDLQFLMENIAYHTVGIFSCADIKIFESGWAQRMFAYYANSLRGLALIYEQKAEPAKLARSINYTDILISSNTDISALSWYDQNFIDMDNFNQKLNIWESEQEKRICSIPGIKEAADFGLELKAILYTQRIQEDFCKVKEAVSDSVDLKEIYAGYGSKAHLFKTVQENKTVFEWITSTFLEKPKELKVNVKFRKAEAADLKGIVGLLSLDHLGKSREKCSANVDERYLKAFLEINQDSNQYLVAAEIDGEIIGTAHLTLMPSLTFTGSTRMQIEAVRVHPDWRGKKIGEQLITHAIEYAEAQGVKIIQLTTNKERVDALRFYEGLGFKATHVGMKLYCDMKK